MTRARSQAENQRSYGTFKFPESYIIDSKGKVVEKIIGEENWTDGRISPRLREVVCCSGTCHAPRCDSRTHRPPRPARLSRPARRPGALRIRRQRRKGRPEMVVFPRNDRRGCRALSRSRAEYGVPIVGRGAGTGLSGGAIPREGGVMVAFARMNRILEIDLENERAVVEPGVVNLDITLAVQRTAISMRPIPPASAPAPSAATWRKTAGGPHTLAYGVTTNHVLGLEFVLPDGTSSTTGGKAPIAGLRSDRPADRLGRHPGAGDQDHRPADAQAGNGQDHSGHLRFAPKTAGDTVAEITARASFRSPSRCWMA